MQSLTVLFYGKYWNNMYIHWFKTQKKHPPRMKRIRCICIVCVLFGVVHLVTAQKQYDSKEVVGFGCGFAGRPTKMVQKMSKRISAGAYDQIRKKLFSKSPSEQYIAVLVCEELKDQRQIVLTKEEIVQIRVLYGSTKKIGICSGCTLFQSESIATLLKSEKTDSVVDFGSLARIWVAQKLARY